MPKQNKKKKGTVRRLIKTMFSFYPVMMCPSAVDVRPMVVAGKRLHHFAVANHFAPRIVPERFRKPSAGAA